MEGLFLLLFVLWLVVSIVTASHAQDNQKSPLWGVLVMFTGIFGLIFYAISLASD